MKVNNKKICFISSSGGHYEQLAMLKYIPEELGASAFFVTEKADYEVDAKYYLLQTGLKDKLFFPKMIINFFKSLKIFIVERPDYVVTTGAMVVIPMSIICKISKKKLIYIETFARVDGGTRTGKLIYNYADLFIVQWESLQKVYPKSIYGGSIY